MNKKYLYLLSFGHLSVDINTGSLPALLPFFVSEYGMDYTAVAGLMFASSFLSSVLQPIFGLLADKGSRQWFMGFGVLLTGFSFAATGFLTSYWSIFAAVTLMGIGSAIFHPEGARNVNAIAGEKKGSGMSLFSTGGIGGFATGPLLVVFLVTLFGMKGLGFYAAFSLIAGILIFMAAPKIRAASGNVSQTAGAQPKTGRNDWPAFGRLFLVILFRSTTLTAIQSFLPLFCIQALGASPALGSATLSLFSLLGVLFTMVGGSLADRYGYVRVLRSGCLLLAPVLLVIAMTRSIWLVYLMLLPLSFAMHGAYSSFVVLGQSYLAKNVGFASGVTLGISFSVGGIVAPSIGTFADSYGIEQAMLLVVGIAFMSGLMSLLLPQPKKT